jgi:hypothetical protein
LNFELGEGKSGRLGDWETGRLGKILFLPSDFFTLDFFTVDFFPQNPR